MIYANENRFHIHIVSKDKAFVHTILKEYPNAEYRVSRNSFLIDTMAVLKTITPNLIIIDYDEKSNYGHFHMEYTYKSLENRAYVVLAVDIQSIKIMEKLYQYKYDDYFLKPLMKMDYIGKISSLVKKHQKNGSNSEGSKDYSLEYKAIQKEMLHQKQMHNAKLVEVIHKLSKDTVSNILERVGAEMMLELIMNKRGKEEFELLYIDIDNLEYIRSNFGKEAVKKIFLQVSELLVQNKKGNEIVARWETNRFVCFCSEMSQADTAHMAKLIHKKISNVKSIKDFTVTCSILCCTISKKHSMNFIFSEMQTNIARVKDFHRRQPIHIRI